MKDFEALYRSEGRYHHSLTGFPRWWTRENYRILSEWVETGELLLDLACGDGAFWPFIPTARVVGIDHAATGLRIARETGENPVARGDMRALPFRTGSFDAAACSLSLQYLRPDELAGCLSEIVRVLRESGRFLFSYPNVRPDTPPDAAHAAIPLESLTECLEKAGFRRLDIRCISQRLPRRLFAWSLRPKLRFIPYLYWRIFRIFGCRPFRSYHYAVLCESPGCEPQGAAS
jgi:SAM-dependent methyltransferase